MRLLLGTAGSFGLKKIVFLVSILAAHAYGPYQQPDFTYPLIDGEPLYGPYLSGSGHVCLGSFYTWSSAPQSNVTFDPSYEYNGARILLLAGMLSRGFDTNPIQYGTKQPFISLNTYGYMPRNKIWCLVDGNSFAQFPGFGNQDFGPLWFPKNFVNVPVLVVPKF
jgi:hypothetical protein